MKEESNEGQSKSEEPDVSNKLAVFMIENLGGKPVEAVAALVQKAKRVDEFVPEGGSEDKKQFLVEIPREDGETLGVLYINPEMMRFEMIVERDSDRRKQSATLIIIPEKVSVNHGDIVFEAENGSEMVICSSHVFCSLE